MGDFYDRMASLYHLIFPDWNESIERQAGQLTSVIHQRWGVESNPVLDVSCGIGTQALGLARRGHRVFASARDPQTIASLGEQTGARIRTLRLDVQDAASCAAAVQSVLAEAGRLDALVNNAGYAQYGSVEDVSIERWQAQFDVNKPLTVTGTTPAQVSLAVAPGSVNAPPSST